MTRVFPPDAPVLWHEPFHGTWVPGRALGKSWVSVTDDRQIALTSIRLADGTVVAARPDRLVRAEVIAVDSSGWE